MNVSELKSFTSFTCVAFNLYNKIEISNGALILQMSYLEGTIFPWLGSWAKGSIWT